MALLRRVERAVQKLTPLALAERSWDNVGLLAEPARPATSFSRATVLLCIDLTPAVATEAIAKGASMLLCYHPPIFSGLKSITNAVPLQNSILRCLAADISIYTIHTAADAAANGTNDYLAGCVLDSVGAREQASVPEVSRPVTLAAESLRQSLSGQSNAGSGRLVNVAAAVKDGQPLPTFRSLVESVKKGVGKTQIQVAPSSVGPDQISTVGICAGSGGGVLKGVKADVWLTGELGHHEILAALAGGTHVILCGHSASERPWLPGFAKDLEKALNEPGDEGIVEVLVSEEDKDPLEIW